MQRLLYRLRKCLTSSYFPVNLGGASLARGKGIIAGVLELICIILLDVDNVKVGVDDIEDDEGEVDMW